MTGEEIRRHIIYTEKQIDQLMYEKRRIEEKIWELEALCSKIMNLQVKFGDRQQQRQSKLTLFLKCGIQNRTIQRYYSGMNNLLKGNEFNNAYNGLSEAKCRAVQEITKLNQQLEECLANIDNYKRKSENWRRQLINMAEFGVE